MARRKNDQGSAILALVALVVAAVAVVGPLFLGALTIIAELKARGVAAVRRASDLISREDQVELDGWDQRLRDLEDHARAVIARGDALGLVRRADGAFDARNSQGRELNFEIDGLMLERARAFAAREALADRLADLMKTWLSARLGVIGARTALLVFVVVFTALTISRLNQHGSSLTLPVLMFGSGSDGADRMVASAVATLVAGVAMWIARSIARASLA